MARTKGSITNCSYCYEAGHNRRTCPTPREILIATLLVLINELLNTAKRAVVDVPTVPSKVTIVRLANPLKKTPQPTDN